MQNRAPEAARTIVAGVSFVLRSLNAITKESAITARDLRWASPDPGLRPQVELSGGDASSLLNLLGSGKALPGEGVTAEEAPPALLQVEPARSRGNEDVMEAGMLLQPGARLQAAMAAEIVRDHENVSRWIIGLNVCQQSDVALGVA